MLTIAQNERERNMLETMISCSLIIAAHLFVIAAVNEGGETGIKLLVLGLLFDTVVIMVVAKGVCW